MSARCFFVCSALLLLFASAANAARYQRTKDGKTLVWNNLRGVAQEATWSGPQDSNGYATGEGTLTWYRFGNFVNSYTGKMVHGKLEGPVIRVQGQTRLQTTFVDGSQVGGWSEPGSTATRTPSSASKEQSANVTETESTEEPLVERPSPSPTLSRSSTPLPTSSPARSPTPTATPTPLPARTPTPILTPTPRPTLTQTPTPRSTSTPAVAPMPTFTPSKSSAPSPVQQSPKKISPLEEAEPKQNSLELGNPPASLRNAPEEVPRAEPSRSSRISPAASPAHSPGRVDPNVKRQMIAELKKQTESVLAQVRDATGNFREIDRLDAVAALPGLVSANVISLAGRAHELSVKLGYETTLYECLAEMETVDALIVVDEVTHDLVAKDAPAARQKSLDFLKRYSEPSGDTQKPLWRYLASAFSLCDRLKNEAKPHLQQARSLESAGKKSEALREYQEINRIYPNRVTVDKIRQLESQPH